MLNWTPTKKLSEVHLFLESRVGRRKISLLPYNSSSPVISPPSRWDAGVCHADPRLQSLGALFTTIWAIISRKKCDMGLQGSATLEELMGRSSTSSPVGLVWGDWTVE
ncbi:hypothetical protein F5877DRAFT_81460 [Lentinula edodes]|nr:hypothetical protein F5877DRAFT_81460 [Lentinula edodes]